METHNVSFIVSLVVFCLCGSSFCQTVPEESTLVLLTDVVTPPTLATERQRRETAPEQQSPTAGVGREATTEPSIPCPAICICKTVGANIEVDCSDRSLQSIPTDIPESTTMLSLNKNHFNIMTADAFSFLPNLEYLYLSQCNIEYLPSETFSGLTKLRNLDLSENQITSINSVFVGLTQLQNLDLSVNNIENIPNTEFSSLTHLEILDISRNHISNIIPGTFDGTLNLKELILSSNNITSLSSYMFDNMNNLQELDMDLNPVTSLPQLVFQHLTSLQQLYLNSMYLSTISDDAFQGLTSLYRLSLSSNRLDSLSIASLVPLSNLTDLLLSANPWRCDCKMKQLYDWLTDSTINFYPTNILCLSPPHVSGQVIETVKTSSFACQPFITQPPRDTMIQETSAVEFTCSVLGDPQPDIYWETPLGEFSEQSTEGKVHVSSVTGSSTLILDSVQTEDAGIYACIANNSRGEDTKQAVLTVQSGAPPTVRPITTKAGGPTYAPGHCIPPDLQFHKRTVTESSIEVEWVPDYSRNIGGYTVKVTKFGVTSQVVSEVFNASTAMYNIIGLESLTQYIICLTPDLSGCSAVTTNDNCLFITTTGEVARPCIHVPISVAVDDITNSSILVKWSSTNTEDAVGYIVQLNQFSIDFPDKLRATNLSVNSYNLQDLTSGTNYIVCVTVHMGTCPSITTIDECKQVTTRGEVPVDDKINQNIDALKKRHSFEIVGVFFATSIGTLLILASIFVIWWRYKKPPSLNKYEFHKEIKKHRSDDNDTGPIQLTAEITSDLTEGASASYFPSDGGYVNQASFIDEGDEIRPYPAVRSKPKTKPRSKKKRPEPVGKEDQPNTQDQSPASEHVVEVYTPSHKENSDISKEMIEPKEDVGHYEDQIVKMDTFDNSRSRKYEQKPDNKEILKKKKVPTATLR